MSAGEWPGEGQDDDPAAVRSLLLHHECVCVRHFVLGEVGRGRVCLVSVLSERAGNARGRPAISAVCLGKLGLEGRLGLVDLRQFCSPLTGFLVRRLPSLPFLPYRPACLKPLLLEVQHK